MNRKIIVVAPHPDDETLGCGGTLLKHKANGDELYWLIITNISEEYGWEKEKVEERQEEIYKVFQMYGFMGMFKLNFPTTKLDEIPISSIIAKISKVFNEVEPDIVFINNHSDIHTDHQIIFQSVMSCSKNFRYPFVKNIYMYETLSETEFAPALPGNVFVPNAFVDISEHFKKKLDIMKIYKSEVMDESFPRSLSSIEALARYRGSRIGVKYAEAFQLLLQIN